MASRINGRAARLPDPTGVVGRTGDERGGETPVGVHAFEVGDTIVVRMYLATGPLELRVPKAAIPPPRHTHIPGFNADATPC
jgi:hypothetical protein